MDSSLLSCTDVSLFAIGSWQSWAVGHLGGEAVEMPREFLSRCFFITGANFFFDFYLWALLGRLHSLQVF